MLNLKPTIDKITSLLEEDTDQSATYAALEARLALEKICYHRLRHQHDYISHAEIKRWQPGAVINTLLTNVDPQVTETRTLSTSKHPVEQNSTLKNQDYVELGTEVGFNAKNIAKMWQALSRLALHVRLPQHVDDDIPEYGNKVTIRKKVEEVLKELKRLSASTMTTSGIGTEVHFDCDCGSRNKRRASFLTHGKSVCCINPDCFGSWTVEENGNDFYFAPQMVTIRCNNCSHPNNLHLRDVMRLEKNTLSKFPCDKCGEIMGIRWQLMQARFQTASKEN